VSSSFAQSVLAAIRKKELVRAGDQVGLAVSGGADSIALLRVMLELREELGTVLKVVHFNHRIRGAAADADQEFVKAVAERHGLEFIAATADTPAHRAQHKLSLEASGRSLRYKFFAEQIANGRVSKVATAHTLDDQAETLLLRLVRGTGLRGLRGVHDQTAEGIIRPLLHVRRTEIEQYLNSIGQAWCEDATNADTHHTRNRIRHELLPLLARDFNPQIADTLARTAEVLTADEEYLNTETRRLLPLLVLPGKPVRGGGRAVTDDGIAIDIQKLQSQPLALRRRIIRCVAEDLGVHLDQQQVEEVLGLGTNQKLHINSDWRTQRGARELRFERETERARPYCYPLALPGEVSVGEMNIKVRASLKPLDTAKHRGTLDGQSLSPSAGLVVRTDLIVRSWRAGDRFQQAHAAREHKVKELLNEIQVPASQRSLWPVIEADGQIVWLYGARNPSLRAATGEQVVIEVEALS
jgi:tRNA(Ile)-lysidine synthase